MSFPWETVEKRRKRENDEELARRAIAVFHRQHRDAVDRINAATDAEIDQALTEFLRKQAPRARGIRLMPRREPRE